MTDFNYLQKDGSAKAKGAGAPKSSKKDVQWTTSNSFSGAKEKTDRTSITDKTSSQDGFLKKITNSLFGVDDEIILSSANEFPSPAVPTRKSTNEEETRQMPLERMASKIQVRELDLKKESQPTLESLPVPPEVVVSKLKKVNEVSQDKIDANNKWKAATSKLSLDANFVEDEETYFFDWIKFLQSTTFGILLIFIVVNILFWGMAFFERNLYRQGKEIDAQIAVLTVAVESGKDILDEIAQFNEQSNQMKTLLDSHIYQTNFFEFIENNTINTVVYENATVSSDVAGSYSLAMGADEYRDIVGQLMIFRASPYVVEAKLSDVFNNDTTDATDKPKAINEVSTAPRKKFSFKIDVKINPNLFQKIDKKNANK